MRPVAMFLLFFLVFAPLYAHANDEIRVNLNGSPLELTQPPIILGEVLSICRALIDTQILIPLREVFEAMGFDVAWDSRTQTVSILRPAYEENWAGAVTPIYAEFLMAIGMHHFRWDWEHHRHIQPMDIPAQMVNGTVMLPLSALLTREIIHGFGVRQHPSMLGTDALWDEEQRLISIYTRNVVVSNIRNFPTLRHPAAVYEPFAFFVVSDAGEIEKHFSRTFLTINGIFETWARLNGLEYVALQNVQKGEGVMEIGRTSPRNPPTSDDTNFVLTFLSDFGCFEVRNQAGHGAALIESLEKTLRGLFYFGEFTARVLPSN